ncbi:alpha-N-acetylglucosaminidase [Gaetbulibacter sp. 4G1]|nr:alpha-N-acetylglucosaminidase [Gaetbulibacter sp. 4G1]PIA77834.1 alpha-N-acetylglucosaminidase [Gaetbulibacter sp. 4G1]
MNKLYCIVIFFITINFISCTSKNSSLYEGTTSPINKLVSRLIPEIADKIKFKIINSPNDVFEIVTDKNTIVISGNNYNSMAVGLNYYLKHYCNTYVSWYANDKIELPETLPVLSEKISKQARVENRFFLNYCTFGYTMPWWQWKDWERFIDWMALNGINMPLAITGQEAIWYDVWKEYGLSDKQIRSYFTGPAHLPWHRMSNLDKWGGALPQSWLSHQKELQKQIVKRERELGMKPVLPAFAGHVPEALKIAQPNAKINQLSSWGGFDDKYRSFFLDPLDPLFKGIQHKFLTKQIEIYGTANIYGADPFNEVHPPSWEPEYLASVSNTIYSSIKNIDSDATWLQMSWIFYFEREHWNNERIEAMIRAVPQDKMMLLDYYCENKEVWKMTDSFFNQPFIWCYLGNFGGNTMMAGNLDEVELRIENALANNKNMWGIGSTLEAFDVNPMMYEYVFEKVWDSSSTSSGEWIKNWADMRHGDVNNTNQKAWSILHDSIYKYPARLGQGTLTNARPTLTGSGNWTTDPTINYNNSDLFKAWGIMLQHPSEKESYKYDVVNIGRQVLGNHFSVLRDNFTQSYKSKNLVKLKSDGVKMLQLLDDLEALLATNNTFLLGKWLNDAKAFATNEEEKAYYEHNARNIITTWGTANQSLNDYANRTWSGLVKGYYKKRWEMFVTDVIDAVENNKSFDETVFYEKVTQFEWEWTQGKEIYPNATNGSSVEIAKRIVNSYKDTILK